MSINVTGLAGGKFGSPIQSTHEVLINYNAYRPMYSPVSLDFLYLPSELPSLTLKVNDIPAICEECNYEYDAALTPNVTSMTFSEGVISAEIQLATTRRLQEDSSLSDLQITFL